MGRITAIDAQKKNKRRVNIYLDGEFAAGLEAVTALAHGLKVGAEIEKSELLKLGAESDAEAAFRLAIDYLSRRMRTVGELRTYLAGKGYSEDAIASSVGKLSEYGYLDDAGFVESYLEIYGDRRGKKRIRQDLMRRGAEPELVEKAIGGLGEQREAAMKAAEKYLRTREFDSRKLCAHLASKGFEWEDISAVVRALGRGEEE